MFVLCEVESFFVEHIDRSRCRVTKPLQVFESKEKAEEAMELFDSFYDYSLRVVESDKLNETFR